MKRKTDEKTSAVTGHQDPLTVNLSAYHLAGHVAALYRSNRLNNIPEKHFPGNVHMLCGSHCQSSGKSSDRFNRTGEPDSGTRNLVCAPVSMLEPRKIKPLFDKNSYHPAYCEHIIMLLAGSLAEAKYISLRDDESFNMYLVQLSALRFYHGREDVANAAIILDRFNDEHNRAEQMMSKLFTEAFELIDFAANWKVIASLAGFLEKNAASTISCQEAFYFLDECIAILQRVQTSPYRVPAWV